MRSAVSPGATQRIIAALVQPMDAVAVETFVPNLHVGAKRVDGGKILNREANRFRRRGEATITESLRTSFAPCHEQFGWHLIVDFMLSPAARLQPEAGMVLRRHTCASVDFVR